MLTHSDRQAAEFFIDDARERAATIYVLRYSTISEKWCSCSPKEAALYERQHPGVLLSPSRVPFRLEGDALAPCDQTLIVKFDQIEKPGGVPSASGSHHVHRVPASSLGVLINSTPDEMIVQNGPNGAVEVYRRSLVLSKEAGPVARVTYKSDRAGSPLVILEGDA